MYLLLTWSSEGKVHFKKLECDTTNLNSQHLQLLLCIETQSMLLVVVILQLVFACLGEAFWLAW